MNSLFEEMKNKTLEFRVADCGEIIKPAWFDADGTMYLNTGLMRPDLVEQFYLWLKYIMEERK